jgi:hypothetical protein
MKRPNTWGLYDMYGNVHEWCADWYDANYYGKSAESDPQGPGAGRVRVLRGSAWNSETQNSRTAYRLPYESGGQSGGVGFRVAITAPATNSAKNPKPSEDAATDMPGLPKGCVVAYSFDKDTIFKKGSEQYVRDLSGNEYHGLLSNVSLVDGKLGTAAEFNGTFNSYVKLPDENGQYPAKDFSIAAWILKYSKEGGTYLDLNFASSAVDRLAGGVLFWGSTDLSFSFHVPGSVNWKNTASTQANVLPRGRWTHIAVTRERDAVKVFINGKLVTSKSMSAAEVVYDYQGYDDDSVHIGKLKRKGHEEWAHQGLIDEFFLVDRALSQREITDLYKSRP